MKRNKLVELIKKINPRAEFKDSGEFLMTNCPLAPWTHQNKRDGKPSCSFSVTNKKSGFRCFSCNHSGYLSSLVYFIEKYTKEKQPKLKEFITHNERFVVDGFDDTVLYQEVDLEPLDYIFYSSLFEKLSDNLPAIKYLHNRKISYKVAERAGLQYDPEAKRILAPVFDAEKKFYGYTSRKITTDNRAKTLDYAGLPKTHLYLGLQFYRKKKPIILVEGLFDWLTLIQNGALKYCTPLATLGVGVSKQKLDVLIELNEIVYVMFDDDEAGRHSAEGEDGVINYLKTYLPVKKPKYPEGKTEPEQLNEQEIFDIFNKKI